MEAMLLDTVSPDRSAAEALPQLSRLFLHYLHRLIAGTGSSRDLELTARLTELWNEVSGRIDEKWTVARLSARMHMSESHFHREVLRLQGRKPMAIVQGIRLDQAAMLLRTTSLGLDAIAPRVGYSSAYALSHAFHRHTGLRPGAYRKAK
jgi:transcriptional regulator GlxA family with amidase domain